MLLEGKCPSVLGGYIASARHSSLVKPGGGIRPIAVDMVWRRLVSKVAALVVGKTLNAYLEDFQFGVEHKGAVMLFLLTGLSNARGDVAGTSLLLVDFKNAFNLVNMSVMMSKTRIQCPSLAPRVEFCYSQPARLYYGDYTLVLPRRPTR